MEKFKFNRILILMIAVMLSMAAVLAACGGKNDSNASSQSPSKQGTGTTDANSDIKGEITVVTHRTDIVDTKFKEYVAKFKEMYPNVTDVKVEGLKDYNGIMQVRIAANELPDVFSPLDANVEKYADLFEPLNDMGLSGQTYFESVHTDSKGNTYMINTGGLLAGIVYNKKAFEAAGIANPPKTLDELYAAVEKLKATDSVKIPVLSNFKDGWPLSYYYTDLAVFYANDANLRNTILDTDTPYTADSPYGKALSVMRKLHEMGAFEKDVFATDWEQSKKDLATGKAGMTFIGQWMVAQVMDNGGVSEELGFIPFPYDNSGKYQAVLAPDWGVGVSKNSKNKATAKAWVKFFTTQSTYADDAGLVPPLKTAKSNIPQLAEFDAYKPDIHEYVPINPKLTEIEYKLQFDLFKWLQEVLVSKDIQKLYEDTNKKWADGRKSAG